MKWLSDDRLNHLRSIVGNPDFSATKYTFVKELGRGGMGAVYLAEDTESCVDLLYDGGEDLMNVPQATRRLRLEKLFRPTVRVRMTEVIVSDRPAAQPHEPTTAAHRSRAPCHGPCDWPCRHRPWPGRDRAVSGAQWWPCGRTSWRGRSSRIDRPRVPLAMHQG